MISKLMEMVAHLKSPQLVASIQQFFGVRIHYDRPDKTFQDEKEKYICTRMNEEDYTSTCQKINGCDINDKQLNVCTERTNSSKRTGVNEPMIKREETSTISNNPNYTIDNPFWYYIFLFGTELGDEIFYSTFIPFLFWNIDGAVGQRVVLVWATVMTIGQIMKDVIRWPRPACPPAVRLQNKWSQEYGMPSTHAMVGFTIPFSVVLFTMHKYIYPSSLGCIIALLWCALVSMSRLYLGMHTVLDIIAGLVLAIALMIPLVPLVDITNSYVITNFWFVVILIMVTIAVIVYYPSNYKWTPTRSDTAMVVSVAAGLHAGAWLNYYSGLLRVSQSSLPFHIVWPTYSTFSHLIIRTVLGFSGVIATKYFCKSFSYITICGILQINWKELMKCQDYNSNQIKVFVDLVYKYLSCFMIGLNTVYLLPQVFNMIGIDRPAFYSEI
ncbi:sphingosine-1-phosphate phosphatase 1 isoform X1 [Solenopsis invicta]|uniref:sphingosine-1-phosphate phosphatase 1 isoform X1 n=1 Tax=Solenopsis invicta TaxID=13686 RepID=UPI0005959847|nr:sphingosine-1-phosphate phosphatase 1 isoform X1 [Solenopsis invicta]XP_011173401.1 sphingosine-1-phosphate phosphatase 1 isoform X1 [Solenopsis invicta]XP_011173404.1 sphingosine-1-phosphate phosphatase 1 isoform X1 [Solenopsis invicta]XP_011173405.1 sphingosine-1-phosphate phosphatase 1 isoform X1 [Solenopsis invicta]XP_011173406.1 sphingosine-1-phosphate phosphatase 1 isoform X1 [Solenopsis invicta]XP_025987535.1 sphingosine-1-phosphate phosphatase 1 isoform X1 [Solenopsis invicta]XP_02